MKCLYFLTLDFPAPFHPHELKYQIKLALKPSGEQIQSTVLRSLSTTYTFMGGLSVAGKVRRQSHGSEIYEIDSYSDLT
ncbi:MAG: hypothetical protein MJE68_01425, partial [Proteobacteria bacterium]|nr:hypothetical protein [Pseudomonadota bacterium]